MTKLRIVAALVALLAGAVPAAAQWQTPNHSVPIGRGGGVVGFGNAAPGVSGQPFVSQGAASDPAFGTIGNAGFTTGPANTAKGTLDGVSTTDVPLPSCTAANSAWRYTSGVGINCGPITVQTGYDMPINAGLSASAAGGALTINLTQASGAAPTAGAPVLIPFRSTTATVGTVTWASVSSALSATVPTGATFGTSNNVPFKVWVFVSYNGGAPQLAFATCSTVNNQYPCAAWETTLKTTVVLNGSSTAAGQLYAPAAVALDAVRIVGYCEFGSGLPAVGTWSSACTSLGPIGPGVKKPGDVVQTVRTDNTAFSSSGGTIPFDNTIPQNSEGTEFINQTITPVSSSNILRIEAHTMVGNNTPGAITGAMFRDGNTGSSSTTVVNASTTGGFSTTILMPLHLRYNDIANGTTATTFHFRIGASSGTTYLNGISGAGVYGGTSNTYLSVEEIQG